MLKRLIIIRIDYLAIGFEKELEEEKKKDIERFKLFG